MKKIIKIILGLLGTIVLGAIGSGLWERVLSQWFDMLIIGTVKIMSYLISTYQDSIYADVANGFHEGSSVFIHAIILMVPPIMYFWVWLNHPHAQTDSTKNSIVTQFVRSKKGYYSLGILTLSFFFAFSISSFKILYTNQIVTQSLRYLDLVAPHLSEIEYRQLVAEFRSIKTKENYETFEKKIRSVSTTKHPAD